MEHLLSEAAHVLCLMVIAGFALPMVFPNLNLRQALAKNKEARLKAMVHLRDYKDDLQKQTERLSPDQVMALKTAAYSGDSSERCAMGAFEVPRWPNEKKPDLLCKLLSLTHSAEREIKLLLGPTNDKEAGIDQIAASDRFRLLASQCRIESIKAQVQDCIPDLEVEAVGLVMARERFRELFAFGLSLEGLRENIAFRPFQIAARSVVYVLLAICFLRSNDRERLEISESKECNRKIEMALAHWRQKVTPQIALVSSVQIGITCQSADHERV